MVADFGCGDCTLAASVRNQVHCFDLVPLSPRVTVCDMAKVLGAPRGREGCCWAGSRWGDRDPRVPCGRGSTELFKNWVCALGTQRWSTAEPTVLGSLRVLSSPIYITILLLLPGICGGASRPCHHPPSLGVSRGGQVPLAAESVDVAVFCLALMGTNLQEILGEANRVLKLG